MPSLTELLTKAGVTIPDGVNPVELAEESDEIKGLATAKNELNQWKLENKPLLESLQSEKDELQKKATEEEDKALKLAQENGDHAKQAEITAKRLKELEDGLNASRERARQSAHDAALQSVAGLFDSPLGADIAATKVFTSLNDAGEPVVEYKIGDQSFSTIDDFKGELAKNESYAAMMSLGDNQGPGVSGQQGVPGGGQPQQPKLSGATKGYLANLKQ